MSADVFYTIGSTHQVCQDYAIAGSNYAIIADGCSSAKDSDWGARLLAKALDESLAKNPTLKGCDFGFHFHDALLKAYKWSEMLGLDEECMASTLLCAYKAIDGFWTFVTGDGYVVAKTSEGLMLLEYKYETGAPCYLYYNLREELMNGYKQCFGKGNLLLEYSKLDKNGKKTVTGNRCFAPDEWRQAATQLFMFTNTTAVGVCTDGLGSFIKQTKTNTSIQNTTLPFNEVVNGFFSFKNMDGQFVHRRCQKEFKSLHDKNIRNGDDFAMGVVS